MANDSRWTVDGLLDHLATGDCRILDDDGLHLAARLERRRQVPREGLRSDLAGTATAPSGTRRLTFPRMRLESEANRRDHWAVKHARAKEQRYTVYYTLRCTYWPLPTLPCTITLTRVAPRALDDDNLVSSCKSCRDGVADWFAGSEGKGNDRMGGVTWRYTQQQGTPREYGLWITLEESPPPA